MTGEKQACKNISSVNGSWNIPLDKREREKNI